MNVYKYLKRQWDRFKIDRETQGTFLAGEVPAIDNNNIIKTVSSNYEELEVIFFDRYRIKPNDTIVDVGCGKGRVFGYLLHKGLTNKMIGYEINPAVGRLTGKRLSKYKNVEILVENIFDDFPQEGNVFYLYNPFKEEMMKAFIKKIMNETHRDPVIIYNNPVLLPLFDKAMFDVQFFDTPVLEYDYSFQFAIIRIKRVI